MGTPDLSEPGGEFGEDIVTNPNPLLAPEVRPDPLRAEVQVGTQRLEWAA